MPAMLRRHHRRQPQSPDQARAFAFRNRLMDWVSATYNKLEVFAVAADRVLGSVVERCEEWLAGTGRTTRSGEIAGHAAERDSQADEGARLGQRRSV
jgi:hypothetical protein